MALGVGSEGQRLPRLTEAGMVEAKRRCPLITGDEREVLRVIICNHWRTTEMWIMNKCGACMAQPLYLELPHGKAVPIVRRGALFHTVVI